MTEQTVKLLEKALQISPADWETRAHLIESRLDRGEAPAAAEHAARRAGDPATEPAQLLKARVELETAPSDAIVTLEGVLAANKACAQAYLILARVYRKRGLRDEARRKYGAATIIDESISDPGFGCLVGNPSDRQATGAAASDRRTRRSRWRAAR